VARFTQHRAPARHATNTASVAHSPSSKIADSNDGRAVNDGINKCPCPFLFDVFAEDDDGLVDNGRPPAKRRCRASSASSSVRAEQAQTLSSLIYHTMLGSIADLNHNGEVLDDHEWQAQRITGERQTPSGLKYKASVQKTLWLPRAVLDTKLDSRS
jgi:hypothetical protein